ncbi:MAG: NAD(P)-dependent glycerol-3-phosphate dehydrogenase [Betaproteobacteria bacterium]|nr:NAD(P)-dependent glycerol-3-phosphate dehydrogenase [Betaproteobacteria bacterium]
MKLSVLSAGAWGTALAIAFSARHQVTLWARETEVVAGMRERRENTRFLPGHRLPDSMVIEADFDAAVASADLLIVATPLAGLRATLQKLAIIAPKTPLVWVCKGLEAGTAKLPHAIAAETLPAGACYGALSGPSFAEEVAQGLPTAVTLAANDANFARETALALHTPRLRIYANDDLAGVEVGGAVKNVLAIATGISDGLGLGLNARAALITRGLAEIARLGLALGGKRDTFMGLAGMGDLILTSTGDLSRNRRVGLALAAGKTLPQILEELGHVAEGVSTAREVAKLAVELGIEMPITQAVDAVLHHGVGAATAVEQLLSRDPKIETA